ncbi:MAG: hypothetical protein LBR69_08210 [Endomicrobium sp.]|jgi:hypothetical protein|nr:hypothetical protein [Endomicrobium sp.]
MTDRKDICAVILREAAESMDITASRRSSEAQKLRGSEARQQHGRFAAKFGRLEVRRFSSSAKAKDKTLQSFCAKPQNPWILTLHGEAAFPLIKSVA